MPKKKVERRERPELSDDWHLDEPLAYLVKRFDALMGEYDVFQDESDARRASERHAEDASDNGDEEYDGRIWPLYAGIGRELSEPRFS